MTYMEKQLDLGWCQGYSALHFHMEEAVLEKNIQIPLSWAPPIAFFSRKYYNDMNELSHEKKYDFCFIGSINHCYSRRKWVIDFAKTKFTSNSIFINTDNDPAWESLGPFDYTHLKLGFCPRLQPNCQSKKAQYRVVKENLEYFEKMSQSKFVLCPAGDSSWSFRFYEVLMCKSIPVVESWHHTYRTKEEANIPYKYVLYPEIDNVNCDDYVIENTKLFETHHLL